MDSSPVFVVYDYFSTHHSLSVAVSLASVQLPCFHTPFQKPASQINATHFPSTKNNLGDGLSYRSVPTSFLSSMEPVSNCHLVLETNFL